MAIHRFSWPNFLIRFLFAGLLVTGTYNPSGYSYTDWVLTDFPDSINAISAFAGIILFVTSAVLAVGMSWSHIRRRMTGQIDTDEVDYE